MTNAVYKVFAYPLTEEVINQRSNIRRYIYICTFCLKITPKAKPTPTPWAPAPQPRIFASGGAFLFLVPCACYCTRSHSRTRLTHLLVFTETEQLSTNVDVDLSLVFGVCLQLHIFHFWKGRSWLEESIREWGFLLQGSLNIESQPRLPFRITWGALKNPKAQALPQTS